MKNLHLSVIGVLLAAMACDASAATCDDACLKKLQAEIATLDADVDAKSAEIVRPGVDAAAWLDKWAIEFVLGEINATDRKFRFRSTRSSGRIAGDDWDCGWFGDGGWYIEPRGGGAARAGMNLGRFGYGWDAGHGERFSVDAALAAEVDVRYHFDPCIGGGFGWNGFVAGVTLPPPTLKGLIGVSTDASGKYAIDISGTSPKKIGVLMVAAGSPVPFFYWRFDSGVVGTLGQLDLSSIVDGEGTLEIPQPNGTPLEKKYQLTMGAAKAKIRKSGYDAEFALTVTFP
jgi:hypothetical protein